MSIKQEEEFENKIAAERYIRRSTPELDLLTPSEVEKFILNCEIIIEVGSFQEKAANSRAIIGNYVVRNEHLFSLQNFLKIVKAGVKLLVGFSASGSLAGWGATSTSLLDAYNLYNAVRDRGFVLSEVQLLLVTKIRDSGPIHTDSLRQSVPRSIADLDIDALLLPLVTSDENPDGVLQKNDGIWSGEGL